jgi:hypothetical protein
MTIKGILIMSSGSNNPNINKYIQPSDDDEKRAQMLDIIGENI